MQDALDENGTDANASGTGTLIVEFENGRTYMIDQNGNVTGPLEAPEETEEPETGGSIETMKNGVIEIKWLMGDTNFESKTANAPVLKTDIENTTMRLVSYDTNGTPIESTDYNYAENRWANAEVEIDYGEGNQKIKSYFVWIPRYAYRIIYFKNDPSKAEYLNGTITEDEAIKEGKIIGYSDSRGIVSIDTEGKVKKVSGTTSLNIGGNYFRVHPAFIDDSKNNYENGGWDEELPGIWVGKYETSLANKKTGSAYDPSSTMIVNESSDYAIRVEQNKSSWRYATIGDEYTSAKAYNTNLNSHMLKNSEWGAVAYLTESKYGRNGEEVTQNTDNSYKTASGNFIDSENQKQGSTGNETGIYDLRGGANERVAAYYTGGNSTYLNNGSSIVNDYANENTKKYVTAYTGTSASSAYKVGDATYETSRWHSDRAYFVNSFVPFFVRGGGYNSYASDAGVFYYNNDNGYSSSSYGFRMCLAVK